MKYWPALTVINCAEFNLAAKLVLYEKRVLRTSCVLELGGGTVWPRWRSVEMGDNMSKRLKLVTTSESEMEERSFINPFPDWDQGVFTSSNSGQDSDGSEPFDANGKVIHW